MSCRLRRVAAIAAAVLLTSGCTVAPTPTPQDALAKGFDGLAADLPATTGIAVAPVGADTVFTAGSWSTGVAWSTIKVPLAIAALRTRDADTHALVSKAITRSDNAASEQLWSSLGPPDRTARRVQAVLRDGGDATTVVESRRLRPGFTAFGQTRWSLDLQARFAAHLPCIPDAGTVVDVMHHLVEGQRWGLASGDTAAKGGWGPSHADGYLVRQFGIVSTANGAAGVALAAESDTFENGVEALNRMAGWLSTHTSELPGGSCPDSSKR